MKWKKERTLTCLGWILTLNHCEDLSQSKAKHNKRRNNIKQWSTRLNNNEEVEKHYIDCYSQYKSLRRRLYLVSLLVHISFSFSHETLSKLSYKEDIKLHLKEKNLS